MKKSFKSNVAKMTSTNLDLNRKALQMKRSWDEVNGLLEGATKNKRKVK